jgi:hypothetical protein
MDTNMVLRDGTVHLTADETLTTIKVGPMVKPLWLHIIVPADGNVGATHKLDVELEFCATGATGTEIYNMNMKQITAAGHYAIPFFTALEYLQVKLNITDDGGGDLDLFHVKVWIDPANRYDGPHNT